MRYAFLFAVLELSALAQSIPDCRGIARDIDVRCACVKDPGGKLCEMVRAGFYDPNRWKAKPITSGWGDIMGPPRTTAARIAQPTQPQKARVVPLVHTDYLRFLHPEAQLAAGVNFEKAFGSKEFADVLFGQGAQDGGDGVLGALKEIDRMWLSCASSVDCVLVMTGRFEQGALAGRFYAQGIRPVFPGGARAMMIGSEASIQGALARLGKPAANGAWVARRARQFSADHETWMVSERQPGTGGAGAALQAVRRFALGFRLTGETAVDGEAVADSEANALTIAAWVEERKSAIRNKTGVGALDSLSVERDGLTLRFTAKGDSLLKGEAGRAAMDSDFGVELYGLLMASFPGMPRTMVARDKLLAVQTGMKREEVLDLLGQPLSVSAIHGLETPRETWTYQVPFGKQFTLRLDGGVVSVPPR